MTLVAGFDATVGGFELAVELDVHAGETVAVIGPNASGKSTLLRTLAGLVAVDHGRILLGGEVLDDPDTRTFVPPHRRSVAMVFQDYALFPHLDVAGNVAFGLRARGMPPTRAASRAGEWLERVGLTAVASRRPDALSGGQRQRVALARALVTEPKLLLLDEPLAALDAMTRAELRRTLADQLSSYGGVRVLVTHDAVDAHQLASHVVVLESGRVSQHGTLSELARAPRSRYVAELAGLNVVAGRADGSASLITARGARVFTADPVPTGDVFATFAPAAVAIHTVTPEGSPRNVWSGSVVGLDEFGGRTRVHVAGAIDVVAEVTPAACAELQLRQGSAVWISVKAVEVSATAR